MLTDRMNAVDGSEKRGLIEIPAPISALSQVRRANRCISKLYNLVLASCGLNATQYVLLRAIANANEISQHELATRLSVATATLSRRLSALRKRGLLKMRLAARGSRVYSMTGSGEAIINSAAQQWQSAEYRLRLALGEADWKLFVDLCERVCVAAQQAENMRVAFRNRTANK